MQKATIFLAYFLICVNCFSQQYPFVHYTPREGLVNNKAKFIYQDSRGRLYIATYGGLSIYDGTRFTNFNYNRGLANDLINDIVEMGEDSVWILSNTRKINCIVNGRLKTFTPDDNFTPLINQLIKCSDGYYYAIADEGLFRLDKRRFIKMNLDGLPEGQQAISLFEALEFNKKLYFFSNPEYKLNGGNILVYDLVKNKLIAYKIGAEAVYLFSPSDKELWLTSHGKFYTLDTLETGNTISLKPLPDSYHFPKDLLPHFICKDRQNNMWFTTTKGVYRIKKDGETTLFTTANGLTTDFQTSIFQDNENNMWFTNEQTGLCKLSNPQLAYYPSFRPGLTPTDLWINPSTDSVWLYDAYHQQAMLSLPNGETKNYTFKKPGFGFAKLISSNGEYILSGNRIFRWTKTAGKKLSSPSLYYTNADSASGFTAGVVDENGNLIVTSNKIIVFANNKVLSEPLDYMTDGLTIDKSNRIWVAPRSTHLFCYKISGKGDSTKFSLLKKFSNVIPGSPRSIAADHDGNLWIGTRNHGLYCLYFDDDLALRSTRNITSQNGLSENFINYLYCDKENNIWACSPSGLDKINVVNNTFSIENVTTSSNLYLHVLKIQETAKGLIWILSSAGIITYNPVRPPVNDWKPQLGFSDIIINNKEDIPLPPDRELKYFQNNLVFQLSAPTYIDEKQTRFSYMLEGSGNENWSEPSTNATINFVNLPPGEYTLKAKAIFLHGLYPDVESSFSFTILPPWWLTWWFKLLSGLLILVVLLLAMRYYINRKLFLQRMVLEKKQAIEKERTRIATDMHDDLGAGLSQIKFLSEAIGMKKQKHLPIEEDINSIRSFSNEMIDKMGEIVWALNEKNDTLNDLLSYTRAYAVEYLEQNGITCHIEEPEILPQDIVSGEFRRNIYLTVKESLHNIVKHARATDVFIAIKTTDKLTIKIRDNGMGIDHACINKFGNGLTNMKKRIEGLQGEFDVENSNGTLVNIEIPLNL